jgi:hypothetical protein
VAAPHGDQRGLIRAEALLDKRHRDLHELPVGAVDEGLVDESLTGAGRFPVGVHQDFITRSDWL